MKKLKLTVLLTAFLSVAMPVTALAGSWQLDQIGWWYRNDDGSWPAACWQWIDGNGDGIAECYYFNQAGYMLAATWTPDGYLVNEDGAWVENGVVQVQSTGVSAVTAVSYQEAYADFLYSFQPQLDNPKFLLAFVDGDSVPELLIVEGTFHACGVDVYTYIGGEVVHVGSFGGVGSMLYAPYENCIDSYEGWTGVEGDYFYRIVNGRTESIISFENDAGMRLAMGQNPNYSINGAVVSEREYKTRLAQMQSLNFVKAGYDNGYAITASNIYYLLGY